MTITMTVSPPALILVNGLFPLCSRSVIADLMCR